MKLYNRKNIFSSMSKKTIITNDRTIEQILIDEVDLPLKLHSYAKVCIQDFEIPKKMYKHVRPNDRAVLIVQVIPRGGDSGQIFKMVALIAIAVGISFIPGGQTVGAQIGFAALKIGLYVGATLALNALIPPPKPSFGGTSSISGSAADATNIITGSGNTARNLAPVTRTYGQIRSFPNYASQPYNEIKGKNADQITFFYALFDIGLGEYEISDIKLGETDLEFFDEVQTNIIFTDTSDDFTIFNVGRADRFADAVGANLNDDGVEVVRTTQLDTEKIEIFIQFPMGLFGSNTSGAKVSESVTYRVSRSPSGAGTFTPYPRSELKSITGVDVATVYDQFSMPIESNFTELIHIRAYSKFSRGRIIRIVKNDFWSGTTFKYKLAAGAPFPNFGDKYFILGSTFTIVLITLTEVTLNRSFSYRKSIRLPVSPPVGNKNDIGDIGQSIPLEIGGFLRTESDRFTVTSNFDASFFFSFELDLPSTGEFDIKLERITSTNNANFRTNTDSSWSSLTSFKENTTLIINTKVKHTFLELKIKSTDQLTGQIADLNLVSHSILPFYDGVDFSNKKATSNPAWIFVDLLTGELNQRAVSKDRIDTNSISEWAEFCEVENEVDEDEFQETYKHETNFAISDSQTVRTLLNSICSTGRASLHLFDSNYGVIIDQFQDIPTQIFSNRNIKVFSSSRNYTEKIDGFSVKFLNRDKLFSVDFFDAFADDSPIGGSKLEELESFGITRDIQAYAFGRYMLAQALLRQEQVTIEVDIENLASQRGDLVLWQQDVMKNGGFPCRIIGISGGIITIDAPISENFDKIQIRNSLGEIIERDVIQVISSTELQLSTLTNINIGSLAVIGFTDLVSVKYIIKEIVPTSNLSAAISLVEFNESIYTAEKTVIADYDPTINPNDPNNTTAPDQVVLTLEFDGDNRICSNELGSYIFTIDLSWIYSGDIPVVNYEVHVAVDGELFELVTITVEESFNYTVRPNDLNLLHEFKVLALSASGAKANINTVESSSVTPDPLFIPFDDVLEFSINVINESLQLEWVPVIQCGIRNYAIRFSPSLLPSLTWSDAYPIAILDRNTDNITINSRTGSYFIKAVNFLGQESLNARKAITNIANVVDLNFIQSVNDFPALTGFNDNTQVLSDSVLLLESGDDEFFSEGFYSYTEFIDLGTIVQARYTSKIEAVGLSLLDFMDRWDNLTNDFVPTMSQVTSSDWSVEAQVRGATSISAIDSWLTLSSIIKISFGTGDDFTEFRKFTSGDFTFKIAQFRIKLSSLEKSVSPRLINGLIEVDMPDRTYSQNDIQSPDSTFRVDYSPYFYLKPAISISMESSLSGDYWTIENSDETGFDITFRDSQDQTIPRTFDFLAKGFGYQNDVII